MTSPDKPVLEYAEKPQRFGWFFRIGEWVDVNERVIFAIGLGALAFGIGRALSPWDAGGARAMMWGAFLIGLFLTPRRFRR